MKNLKMILFVLVLAVVLLLPYKAKAIEQNPLKHLEVRTIGGQGNFDLSGGKKSFSFRLRSTNTHANIIAEATNESYTITGAGKVECKDGKNVINVVVTDPSDNSSVTYTINLTFSHVDSVTDDDGNPRTGASLDIAVILGLTAGAVVLLGLSRKRKFI